MPTLSSDLSITRFEPRNCKIQENKWPYASTWARSPFCHKIALVYSSHNVCSPASVQNSRLFQKHLAMSSGYLATFLRSPPSINYNHLQVRVNSKESGVTMVFRWWFQSHWVLFCQKMKLPSPGIYCLNIRDFLNIAFKPYELQYTTVQESWDRVNWFS